MFEVIALRNEINIERGEWNGRGFKIVILDNGEIERGEHSLLEVMK